MGLRKNASLRTHLPFEFFKKGKMFHICIELSSHDLRLAFEKGVMKNTAWHRPVENLSLVDVNHENLSRPLIFYKGYQGKVKLNRALKPRSKLSNVD